MASVLLQVLDEQRPRLWGYFLRSAADEEDAADLLQETMLRVWDHRKDLAGAEDEPEAVRRYLWRVARNLMIDEIRARVRRREQKPGPPSPGENPGPAQQVEWRDCLRVLRQTVRRLPNRRARRCVELWLSGSTLVEIAGELGLQVGQARGLLQRGKSEVMLRAGHRFRAGRSGQAGDDR